MFFDVGNERFARCVLVEFCFEANEPLHDSGQTLGRLAAGAERLGKVFGVGHNAEASAIHGDITMTFEQAHHASDLVEHNLLLRAGNKRW